MASNTVVQTNMLALNAHRNLTAVGSVKEKSSQKLSSGYKINSAADDAAGLAISEKMRAQIRGLDGASKNTQDAISLIQTAEGGMSTINDMLKRIRDLVEDASNDTKEATGEDGDYQDRQKIQDEINSLIAGIDDIAGNTEFNKKRLLSGDYDEQVVTSYEEVTDIVTSTIVDQAAIDSAVATDLASLKALKESYETAAAAKVNLDAVMAVLNNVPDESTALAAFNSAVSGLQDIISGLSAAATSLGSVSTGAAIDFTDTTTGVFGNGSSSYLDIIADTNTSVAVRQAALNSLVATLTDLVSNASATDFFGMDLTTAVNLISGQMTLESGGNALADLKAPFAAAVDKIKIAAATLIDSMGGGTFVLTQLKDIYSGQLSDALGGSSLASLAADLEEAQTTYDTNLASATLVNTTTKTDITTTPASTVTTGGVPLWFQIGANAGQGISVHINGVDSKKLGIGNGEGEATISVLEKSGDDINALLDTIDAALSYVTTERSKLGAVQNRLEYTNENLQVASENLSNAESLVKDTDMAKEMMSLTKANVIQQAAISMLAQANQAPQSVLQLLQ